MGQFEFWSRRVAAVAIGYHPLGLNLRPPPSADVPVFAAIIRALRSGGVDGEIGHDALFAKRGNSTRLVLGDYFY
jgi:hypothetical protein